MGGQVGGCARARASRQGWPAAAVRTRPWCACLDLSVAAPPAPCAAPATRPAARATPARLPASRARSAAAWSATQGVPACARPAPQATVAFCAPAHACDAGCPTVGGAPRAAPAGARCAPLVLRSRRGGASAARLTAAEGCRGATLLILRSSARRSRSALIAVPFFSALRQPTAKVPFLAFRVDGSIPTPKPPRGCVATTGLPAPLVPRRRSSIPVVESFSPSSQALCTSTSSFACTRMRSICELGPPRTLLHAAADRPLLDCASQAPFFVQAIL